MAARTSLAAASSVVLSLALIGAPVAVAGPAPAGASPDPSPAGASPAGLEIEFIGNMAFRISDGVTTLLSDFPYRSGAFGYMAYAIDDPARLHGATSLVTHGHADHWEPTLLARFDVRVVGHPDALGPAGEARSVPWGDRIRVGDATVVPIATPHAPGHHSYRVEWNELRLYFTGDTESVDALLAQRDLDVAFVSPWLLRTLRERQARVDARHVVVYHHTADEAIEAAQPVRRPRQGDRWHVAAPDAEIEASPQRARDGAPAPLVLVSMDGFRWDYLDLYDTPNLDRVIDAGVRAEGLVPVFPSKTFPSHYSIVTGLYPGHHGIISNNMRDPRWPETFSLGAREEVENPRWWGGEPIWVTAARNGIRSAVYFWPGSEAPVGGVRPDHWRRFDASVSFDSRVDQVLEWLALPATERPGVVALYFGEPNNAGHTFGPRAEETRDAVVRVDRAVGRLLDGLDARGGMAAANLVFVSDHGMAQNSAERIIRLDDHVELLPGELFEQGALVQIFPRPGREEHILEALQGAHPNLHVHARSELPDRFHLFDHPRLPPILATPDPGWEAVSRWVTERDGWAVVPGDHGQDPGHPDMHGLFVAAGPAFVVGARVGRIEAVDVYQMLAAALGIEPAPNDGDRERVVGILR